jgi:hypothetical protein
VALEAAAPQTRVMTMPAPEDEERAAQPLGSDVTGDEDGDTSGVAGPSFPPEETEPDAS